jgi:choline dehydrogenase
VRSADPFDKPVIDANYLGEESDRHVLLAGLKLARKLLRTQPMQPYFAGELYPGDAVVRTMTCSQLRANAAQRCFT